MSVNKDRAAMLPLVSKGINTIFHEPTTVFWTGKVMDILFHGIDVDCTSHNFNSKAICSVFADGEVESVTRKEGEPGIYKFSLLGNVS